ncbi:MAG TPA: JAB domain-containing protein [Tepidisphaeraceae bacterium]
MNHTSTSQVREVVVKYRGPRFAQRAAISQSKDAATLLRKMLLDNSREHFLALYLDGAHTAIGFSRFTGIANACLVHPREILQPALVLGAAALIVAHNHPSGRTEPSESDSTTTNQIRNACGVVGIRFLDHIVLGDAETFYSYSDHGHV